MRRTCVVAVLLVCALSLVGCSHNKTGKLVGVSTQMSLNDMLSGKTSDPVYTGSVIVELKDGTKVRAACDPSLVQELRGGQKLVIAPAEKEGEWKVVKALR